MRNRIALFATLAAVALWTAPAAIASPYSECLARPNTTIESCAYLKPSGNTPGSSGHETTFDTVVHGGAKLLLIGAVVAAVVWVISLFMQGFREELDRQKAEEAEHQRQAELAASQARVQELKAQGFDEMVAGQAQAQPQPRQPQGWRAVDEVLGEDEG